MSGGPGPGRGPRGGRPGGPGDLRAKIDRAIEGAGQEPAGPRRGRPGAGRPPLRVMTTTLWEYPSQHYDDSMGRGEQGSKGYIGATPSWVIWQVLQRYSQRNDLVVDPMCGSGTTLDVCRDLGRRGVGYDLNPQRAEIVRADARELPLEAGVASVVFVDPPYSTHIEYSADPACIGKLDAGAPGEHGGAGEAYYAAMEEVIAEAERVLRPGGHLAIYVSDSWRKEKGRGGGLFMPIGFELFGIMRDYVEPVDIVCVVRHNTKLGRGNWHKAAEEGNFFLRGFNYLLLGRKG